MREDDEIELKLDLPAGARDKLEDLDLLRSARPQSQQVRLQSVYFDTQHAKLRRGGISLRVRSDGKSHIQTVKASTSTVRGRREWEWEIGSARPDLDAAKQTGLDPFRAKNLAHKLRPLFATRVERTLYSIGAGSNLVELAFDEGDVKSAETSRPIREIEIELKKGEPSQLFRLARELSERATLRLLTRSKSTRGYDLLAGHADGSVKASKIDLKKKVDTEEAFQIIANTCLTQIADNYDAVARGDPEGVHQMRVGLRRFRAAMSLFKQMLGDRESRGIKSKLKWLTEELGPARQLHVFMTGVVAKLGREDDWDHAFHVFEAAVRDRATEAEKRAIQAVNSEAFRALLLNIAEWIDAGYWRLRRDQRAEDIRRLPASKFAGRALKRRARKIAKRGRKLRTLSARKRHKLRIACKKLRYGSEFFESVLSQRTQQRRQKVLKTLKELLDCLGALNDVSAHQTLAASMLDDAKNRSSVNIAFEAGRAHASEACRTNKLLRNSIRAHRQFAAAKARSIV